MTMTMMTGREQALESALRDLIWEVEAGEARDRKGHRLTNNAALLDAKLLLDGGCSKRPRREELERRLTALLPEIG
jgi:hypothetical protein